MARVTFPSARFARMHCHARLRRDAGRLTVPAMARERDDTAETGRGIAGEIDTRGLLCPLPVLKARKALARLAAGDRLRMIADDPAARVDVPHFCAEQGHALLSAEDTADGTLVFVLAKGA